MTIKLFPHFLREIALTLVCFVIMSAQGAPVFPLKASADGRYLVDQNNEPFFYHGDTAWCAVKKLTLEEFEQYLDSRQAEGFNAVHLHTFTKEQGPVENRAGHGPFNPPDDISKPNEAYWQHFDAMLQAVEKRGLLAVVPPIWIRPGGADTQGWRTQLQESLAQGYGRWIGRRYAKHKNILWVLVGDANPIEKSWAIDELGRGLKAMAPHHLITAHNRSDFASAAFFDAAPWLDVNMAYTYAETYGHVLGEWNRVGKKRPIILGESGYEQEDNDKRGGAPHRIRRQAYEAILSGALGGHAYGHKHLWSMRPEWRSAMYDPGSKQMKHVKHLFASRPWYKLIPDQNHDLVTAGFGDFGKVDFVCAARSDDRSLALAYFPTNRTISVDLGRLGGDVIAKWFDPTDGSEKNVEGSPFPKGAKREFTPPLKNAAGESDWVLLMEIKPFVQAN